MIVQPLGELLEATDVAITLLQLKPHIGESVLERLARAARCEWGAYWVLDPVSRRLRAIAVWNALGVEGDRLERDTRVRTLEQHEGNAGRVWRDRNPLWRTDLALELCLPRSVKASQAGVRAGVWFGVQTDSAVHGVIELLSRHMPYRRYETLVAVERAGLRLGYALEELQTAPSRIH